jgi:vancomycin resistance protein VanW
LERHNHSVDIYTEATRFCPLGSDATVVYGYKDLRIKNIFSFPIAFQMQISDAVLTLTLLSTEKINEKKINFHVEKLEGKKLITVSDESGVLYRSEYLELVPHSG